MKRLWTAGIFGVLVAWWLARKTPTGSNAIVPDRGVNPPVVEHGQGTRPLTAFEKWALSEFIPQTDLDRAVMHVGELPVWAALASIRPNAITVGNDIYFREVQHFVSPKGLSLIAHELVHVGQFRQGMTVPTYLWASRDGYTHETEFEKPAYATEKAVLKAMHTKLRGLDFGV
jgi:hypothetical protein